MIAAIEARIRRLCGGPCRSLPRWGDHKRMFDAAYGIVQVYYIITATFLYGGARDMSHLSVDPEQLDLLWPLLWMKAVEVETAGLILANAYVIVGFAGIFLWRSLAVRALVSLVLLQYAAWPNSFGAIHHGEHEWFWLSVCFLFLPAGSRNELRASRSLRTRFLYGFSVAPTLILFFYTLSGIYKIKDATEKLLMAQYGGFMPDAMAQTLARRALETHSDPMWAGVIIDYPILGWPLYLALYFVELVAIVVAFRPVLHRIWGFILIGFHFGTLTFMDIPFSHHVLINGLLFVMSPFAPEKFEWREAVRAIPLLGWMSGPLLARFEQAGTTPAQ